MQLVPVSRNAPPPDVPRAFQQSIGRGRRYRGNFYKEDRNRPPSFKLAGLVQAWGNAKKNIGKGELKTENMKKKRLLVCDCAWCIRQTNLGRVILTSAHIEASRQTKL